ncbi:hypothetical protein [Celeribacter halophilus]|uniref:hypothetical protein n=1 Tax=Celeribacter halophilus TaxID=576117 RepID=UPI003A8F0BE3
METKEFTQFPWTERLAKSLTGLSETQKPFLETYWKTTGFPRQITFNGKDETTFPWDDYNRLYEDAQISDQSGNAEYYAPLRKALEAVYAVLRDHPALALVPEKGTFDNAFHVSIVDTTTLSTFSCLVAGQMAQNDKIKADRFKASTAQLNSLLHAPIVDQWLNSSLLQGKDIALFYGVRLEHEVELCEGYSIAPFHLLREHLDSDWIRDVATQQIDWRKTEAIFGIVRNFNWRPRISSNYHYSPDPPRTPPPLFHRWADEFSELMSISLGSRISWLKTFEGCVSRSACELLGQPHHQPSSPEGRSISHLFSSFVEFKETSPRQIKEISNIFEKRSVISYAKYAPIIHRLAEAHRREGRFSSHDRILDLAIVFERLFKPSQRQISSKLQEAAAELLAKDDGEKKALRATIKHLYDVRSAIVHGPTDSKKERLLMEVGEAWIRSSDVARRATLKKLASELATTLL